MDPFVRRFIRSSLLWLGVGVTLGVLMTVRPAMLAFRPAHMHANLLGFVSMMIFGVAYHVIPRFTGRPLQSPGLAALHLWLPHTAAPVARERGARRDGHRLHPPHLPLAGGDGGAGRRRRAERYRRIPVHLQY